MIRYHIVQGDRTTAGGRVVGAGENFMTIAGMAAAYEGDLVNCPACGHSAPIVCDGQRTDIWCEDRRSALSGDICACQCRPQPRLINSQTFMFDSSDDEPTTTEALPAAASALEWQERIEAAIDSDQSCDEGFCIVDQRGQALARMAYRIRTADGVSCAGTAGEDGITHRHSSDQAIALKMLMRAPEPGYLATYR